MTHFDKKLLTVKHIKIDNKQWFILAAATGDNNFLYYFLVVPGDPPGKLESRAMMIIKSDINTGAIIK